MLFRILSGSSFQNALIGIVLSLPAVLLCLTVHELSHGLVAYALGDDTAKRAGRLTLDPFSHLEPVGFFCMVLFGFGWARPVPVNISNFKNRRTGMAVTALAGPVSNMVLAFLCYLAVIPLSAYLSGAQSGNMFLYVLTMFFQYTAMLSIGLGVFNMIPVYPFDGSRVLDALMPFKAQVKFDAFCRKYQTILVLVVLFFVWKGALGIVDSVFDGLIYSLAHGLLRLIGLI